MGRDHCRITPPRKCIPLSAYEAPKINFIGENYLRLDGRNLGDLRPISIKAGVVPCATGSAYLECGNTKVIASVHGPRDVLQKSDSLSKGPVYCAFKYATFSCKERQEYIPTAEEMCISKAIEKALKPVILLEKIPKGRLDILIFVLENDGAALSAGITCAGIALSNAGVEMYDLPVGCTLVYVGKQILVDPTAHEENSREVHDEEEIFDDPTADEEYYGEVHDEEEFWDDPTADEEYYEEEYYEEENLDDDTANEECVREPRKCTKVIFCMMPTFNKQVIYLDSAGILPPSFFSGGFKLLSDRCLTICEHVKNYLKEHVKKTCSSIDSEDIETQSANCMKLFEPHKYLSVHLANNIRSDGRELKEFRSVLINVGTIGTAYGSALVRLNNTSVLCGVKADLTMPTSKEPNKGFLIPNVTLLPVCSTKFQYGPPGEQAQAYSRMITDLVINSDFIDLSSLCISEGKLAWCLFVEMMCLSHDGNILDACLLAMMAALRNTKLPEIHINIEEEEEKEEIEVKDTFSSLNLNYFIFSVTFACLENQIVADPSEEEENLASGTVTVFIKGDNSVLIQSFGAMRAEDIYSSVTCARIQYKEMKQLIETSN